MVQHRVITIAVLSLVLLPSRIANAEWDKATASDGVEIHFEATGTGTPLFLIAGGPGQDSERFRFTHTLLQPSARLVFVDGRGRGKSVIPDGKKVAYSLEKDVDDIEAVRQKLGTPKIMVLGHSYGSMVAMAYAAKYPEHTAALISVSGCHGATVWQERNIEMVKVHLERHYPERWKRIVELHEAGHSTGQEPLAPMFGDLNELLVFNPESDWRLYPQLKRKRDPVEFKFNREVYLTMVGPDPEWKIEGTLAGVELLPRLKNYPGPALVIGGRHDRVSPPLNQVEIAKALPNAELVFFERSSHSPSVEEPLRFIRVVSEFIDSLPDQE
ncbi:MAG: alpha/beta hydrolase [Phycisphaerae bacterium]|nr:alpha/beta fold hydrolase [Phycisphaerales bacterium]